MRILGIDPGLANTGWGVVDGIGQRFRPVSFGVIRTSGDEKEPLRIHDIAVKIGDIAQKYAVETVGIEDIYFTRNISSAISVAKVIGAVCHELAGQELPIRLYSPVQIKSTITGYGGADKKQMQEMVRLHLGLKEVPKPDHAADALSVAICLATLESSRIRMGKRI
ncbi:MAG: crossover junction endodeoxyribonuclease RuvC [Spirochaetia bacterium]|nr:crossover junction endodeoxyribonuclease RuvC [Spirochaetia bacterium]